MRRLAFLALATLIAGCPSVQQQYVVRRSNLSCDDANRYAFAAKLHGKVFAPGAYRLRAVARDAGENVSKTAVAAFRVVR